jgi:hypothetical protein
MPIGDKSLTTLVKSLTARPQQYCAHAQVAWPIAVASRTVGGNRWIVGAAPERTTLGSSTANGRARAAPSWRFLDADLYYDSVGG